MLTGIHLLLTYMCNSECDHCFVYSGPNAKGTFTLSQIRKVLDETTKIGTINWIYFEGGEPFLFYPLMLEAIKIARSIGLNVGVVTNAYYATSEEDAELWLSPLDKLEISDLSISDDSFHYEKEKDNPAKRALASAKRLGIPVNSICIEKPSIEISADKKQDKGAPVIGGGAMFRGRAVEKLVKGLPQKSWEEFTECPYEDLKKPERVHLDSYGNVHLCQGLTMGNMWKDSLSALVRNYNADSHPICGPLFRGGPALLAKEYDVEHEDKYVDACHFCYLVRLALINRFPQYLAPRQVYGLE
jgi:MoaA/NifB/PqqE/SkfB family radical SAM enzyme